MKKFLDAMQLILTAATAILNLIAIILILRDWRSGDASDE